MPIICPECQKSISPFKARGCFACPFCGSSLTSNFWRIVPFALPTAIAAEAAVIYALSLLVNAKVFNGSLAFVVWINIFGITSFATYWACVNFFVKIKHVH
jgi:hypothetical protein